MLQDLRALVDDLVRDTVGRLGEAARDRAIGLAVVQYGKDRPRSQVTDIAAQDDPAPRHLPLPDGWVAGASAPLAIEHPIGHVPACHVPRHCWAVLDTPTGTVIGLPPSLPANALCRLTWSLPHQLGDTIDTVPVADREALAQYAAGLLLDQVAVMRTGDQSSVIRADSVDHGESGPNYAARAAAARKRYHDLLGIDLKRVQPASVTVHPPMPSTTGGGRLLFRRGRK